jgi:hypothetical protein
VTPDGGRPSLQGDLDAIRQQVEVANSDLYRQLALYLQVLRGVVPRSVEQACFHLVTQIHPARYRALLPQRRAQFHRRISSLVSRCSSLLTVEQLIHLAAQMAQERVRQRQGRQQELLERLQEPEPGLQRASGSGGVDSLGPDFGTPPDQGPPQGSVHLGFDLPLSGGWLGWGEAQEPDEPLSAETEPDPEAFASDPAIEAAVAEVLGAGHAPSPDLAALLSAFAAASELVDGSVGTLPPGALPLRSAAPAAGDASPPGLASAAEVSPGGLYALPVGGGLLPSDPVALLAWLEGYDRALARRLRNLSHSLNGELLRLGLSPILLPLNLLDAVLAGQVDGQTAPPNILKLPLPLGLGPSQVPLQAQAILLRSEDLEQERPQLRTVRRRLLQHRMEIRRLAQSYRRLQMRLQTREAEALWLQEIRTMRAEPEGPQLPT